MEKTIWFGVLIALLLFGAIFVTAQLSPSNAAEASAPDTAKPACTACGCAGQCGGSCGVEGCGCGR